MICRDRVSEYCRTCKCRPRASLVLLQLARVVLSLAFFLPRYPTSRIGDNREVCLREVFLQLTCLGSPPAFGVEKDASDSCDPSVSGSNRSNVVSFTSFSRSKFPSADESQRMVRLCVWQLPPRGRSFRCCIRSLSYLSTIWEFLFTATNQSNRAHCIIFNTDW